MKDIITVTLDNGSKDMELVFHYEDKTVNKNYIIYKELDKLKLYLASYKYMDNKYILDTDLSIDEINKINYIFKKYIENR